MHGYNYARHPVIASVNAKRFVAGEQSKITRILKKEQYFSRAEYSTLRSKRGMMEKLQLLMPRVIQSIEHMSSVEKKLTQTQRNEMVKLAVDTVSTTTGIPSEFIHDIVRINWTPKNVQELTAGGPVVQPKQIPSNIPPEELRQLHAFASKRINHDMLINGNSLRVFTQAFPLMREKIRQIDPKLYKTYVGFAGTLQLMNLIYEGKAEGLAIATGKANVHVDAKGMRVIIPATSFPALFNEVTKAVYEALLYEGLPKSAEIAGREEEFRQITGNLELDFFHHKLGPKVSQRVHQTFTKIVNENKKRIIEILEKAERPTSETFAVSMMYKAFAQLSPVLTNNYMVLMSKSTLDTKSRKTFTEMLLKKMEEVL